MKLVKYKVGKKNSVFFFLYRDKNDENSLSGFYFFVIKKKEDLHNLENFVVDKNSKIFIIENNNNIKVESFDKDKILDILTRDSAPNHSRDKYPNYTKNFIAFEMIDDLDDPTSQLLPFILHSRVS